MGKNKKNTKAPSGAVGNPVPYRVKPSEVKPKKKLDSKAITLIVTAAVAAAIIIAGAIFFAVDAYNNDADFEYLDANLSRYVEIDRDAYRNYSLNIDIARPHVKNEDGTGVSDVDVAILSMIASDVPDHAIDGALSSSMSVAPGDAVYFWYRAYILDGEGLEVEVSSNFTSELTAIRGDSNKIIVGSNTCPPGIELGLVGKSAMDNGQFKKITSGTVTADHVVYLNYTRVLADQENATPTTRVGLRLDLSDPEIYAIWGETLVGKTVGSGEKLSFELTIEGKKYNYTDTTVEFVTDFENKTTGGPIVIEGYYPYDYTYSTLRNETVYYEIYIEGVVAYNEWHKTNSGKYDISYDWTDEYVTKKVSEKISPITMDELLEFEGETLTEKYESYAVKYLDDAYEEALRAKIESAMWTRYHEIAKIKRYPGAKVEEVYQQYLADVDYQYEIQGGMIEDSLTGESTVAEDIDEFAIYYLGLQYYTDPDWKGTLYSMAQSLVAERIIFYYIMEAEGLTPTKEVLETRMAEVKEEYLEEYINQYLDYQSKTREDIEDWDKFVEDRKKELFDYYDDDFFTETTYYEIVLDTLVSYPTVTTLDGRRAYPVTK